MDKLTDGALKLGLHLNIRQLLQFEIFYHELIEWNERINLTAITDYEEVQVKHFLDTLTITISGQPVTGSPEYYVIDVGTGAGIPGVPLKIIFPNINLVLLDSTRKKTDFLFHLVEKLNLSNVEIVTGRAENIAHQKRYREHFDLVISRAVAPLPTLLELTVPFCTIGGMFIALKKGAIEQEVTRAEKTIGILGGNLREVKEIDMSEFNDHRKLVIVDKVSSTPVMYPRRPGIPSKRPIQTI